MATVYEYNFNVGTSPKSMKEGECAQIISVESVLNKDDIGKIIQKIGDKFIFIGLNDHPFGIDSIYANDISVIILPKGTLIKL